MSTQAEDIETRGRFVENLTPNHSVFRHSATGVKYAFEPNGFVGSVIEVPQRVAKDPYLLRAVRRGKLRVLTDAEADAVLESLIIREDAETTGLDLLQQALEEGAGEKSGSRFVRDDLPEYGRELGEITQEEIWNQHRAEQGQAPRAETVRPAGTGPATGKSATDLEAPLAPEDVLTAPVKQGEWTPDTGPSDKE